MQLVFILVSIGLCSSELIARYYGNCEADNQDAIKISTRFGNFANKTQYVNISAEFMQSIGNDLMSTGVLDSTKDGKKYTHMLTIKDNGFCGALHKNLGEFLIDIEKALNIPVKKCPLPKGNFVLNKFSINLKKIPMAGFPKTTIRVITDVFTKSDRKHVACLKAVLSNV